MPHGLVSSLLQDAVDVVQGGAVLATRKFVLGSLLWAVVGGKCSLEVVGFQCRGVSGLYLLCQADHVEFTPVEVLMDEAVFCIIGMRTLAKQPAFCQRCCPLTPYTHWQHIVSLCSFTRERALMICSSLASHVKKASCAVTPLKRAVHCEAWVSTLGNRVEICS